MTNESQNSQPQNQSLQLPRSGWNSQITYMKVLLKTKQALVRDESRWIDRGLNK